MMNGIPSLNHEIVRLVLKGKKNQEIISELGLKGDRNGLNFNINTPRAWFKSHKRETIYAKDLISVLPAEEIQAHFTTFCSMSAPMQKIARDLRMEKKLLKMKRTGTLGNKEAVSA